MRIFASTVNGTSNPPPYHNYNPRPPPSTCRGLSPLHRALLIRGPVPFERTRTKPRYLFSCYEIPVHLFYINSSLPRVYSTQVLRVEADALRMVDSVSSGDVAVAVGMPHASTGDTLVALDGPSFGLQLDGVTIPPPVFSLAVEAESASQQVRRSVNFSDLHGLDRVSWVGLG